MKHKRYRGSSLNRDLLGLTGTSMTIGMGSMMTSVPALNAPAGLKEGFTTAASFMPLASATVMTKHMMKQIKKVR